MSIEERVRKIVVDQLGVKEEEVTLEASFVDDLGADSLDTVELVMALEEEFDCEIPDEEAQKIVPRLGLATVYRNIKILCDEGFLREVRIPGEAPRYELEGKGHHHHFYCFRCGRVFEIEGCRSHCWMAARWSSRLASMCPMRAS